MKPILVAVDDQPRGLELIQRELRKRYAEDYEILCEESPGVSLDRLERLKAAGEQVVILLAAHRMDGMVGAEYFAHLLWLEGGDVEGALASDYQGWASYKTRGMYDETRDYVDDVLALVERLRAQR